MSTPRFPANLTSIAGGVAARPLPLTEPRRADAADPARHGAAVLDRKGLFDTIERIGTVAPTAPLSFLVVNVEDLAALRRDDAQLLMRLICGRVRALTRATDAVGRMGSASLGVLLQGTGATAAGAVAARLSHHLSQVIRNVDPTLSVCVSAATGTGINWDTLPVAATQTLPDPA